MPTPPQKRKDCLGGTRPCPWVRCKHHMVWCLSGVKKMTNRQIIHKIFTLKETCVLDVADKGGVTLDEIGNILGITRERVRQIEFCKRGGAIRRLRHRCRRGYLQAFASD